MRSARGWTPGSQTGRSRTRRDGLRGLTARFWRLRGMANCGHRHPGFCTAVTVKSHVGAGEKSSHFSRDIPPSGALPVPPARRSGPPSAKSPERDDAFSPCPGPSWHTRHDHALTEEGRAMEPRSPGWCTAAALPGSPCASSVDADGNGYHPAAHGEHGIRAQAAQAKAARIFRGAGIGRTSRGTAAEVTRYAARHQGR